MNLKIGDSWFCLPGIIYFPRGFPEATIHLKFTMDLKSYEERLLVNGVLLPASLSCPLHHTTHAALSFLLVVWNVITEKSLPSKPKRKSMLRAKQYWNCNTVWNFTIFSDQTLNVVFLSNVLRCHLYWNILTYSLLLVLIPGKQTTQPKKPVTFCDFLNLPLLQNWLLWRGLDQSNLNNNRHVAHCYLM